MLTTHPIVNRLGATNCALCRRYAIGGTAIIVTNAPQLSTNFLGEKASVTQQNPHHLHTLEYRHFTIDRLSVFPNMCRNMNMRF